LLALSLRRSDNSCRIKVKQVLDKLIWVLGLDAIGGEAGIGKIFQVECHDHPSAAAYGCSQYMAVVGIGQGKSGDQRFIVQTQASGIARSISSDVRSSCSIVRSVRFFNKLRFHSP
jgi:hypothetical protein